MASHIGRRKFLATLGGAGAWPLAARAQQAAMPVVGYLNLGSPESDVARLTGLRRGLSQTGYIEGRNLVIEYRWAGNQADRLPALAADLVQLRAAVIVSPGLVATLAAKAATTSIPIVFLVGNDPVQRGLVGSLNRPGSELVASNVSVLIALGPASWAAKRATSTIPIVMAFSGDPVGNGVVSNSPRR